MPKQVKLAKGKEFTFAKVSAAVSKYPWDSWFGGDLLMLEKDTTGADGKVHKGDFDVDVKAMPAKIKAAARRRYKIVQISFRDADGNKLKDSIIIKGRDMTPEERGEEDVRRAEEREARKAAAETEASANGEEQVAPAAAAMSTS